MTELPKFYFALREDLKNDKRFLPTKAEPLATGWDVRAAQLDRKEIVLRPGQRILIPLGIRGFCPNGWWYELKPRSSTFGKKHMHCLIGTIDESYEGELLLAAQYMPDINGLAKDLVIAFGDALGQIIPVKRIEADMLEASNEGIDQMYKDRDAKRGTGGFGSTG